ncbi:MAG TPA: FHA domain-containing protein [Phototrophicaceae bacterium]|jgi:hypothetical protein|nr:FHA domain-containing protein [Phototrophicaceae bacterium]
MGKSLFIEILGEMTRQERILKPYSMVVGFKFSDQELMVGSSSKNPSPGLILSAGTISRKHARIFQSEGEWYVQDLGSDNGTWLITEDKFILAKFQSPVLISGNQRFLFATIVLQINLLADS